mgnify:CR=1 FL=1
MTEKELKRELELYKEQQITLLNRHIDNMLEGRIPLDGDIIMKCVDKTFELEGVKPPSKRVIRKGQQQLRKKLKQREKERYRKINGK